MNKLIILIGTAITLAACNPSTKKFENLTAAKMDTANNQATINDKKAVIDPVCKMKQGEEKFTDFSIYNKDTVWFCSPHCKKMFDKAPEKYISKK